MTTKELQSLPIAVLCGGIGAERKVSLVSGDAVYRALAVLPDGSLRPNVKKIELTGAVGEIAALEPDYGRGRGLVFLALHGEYGEDGTVQTELDKYGILYTGSSAEASALAMDKNASKQVLAANGVPIAAGFTAVRDTADAAPAAVLVRMEMEKIPFPVVVKPNGRGSSVGVTIVRETAAMASALQAAFAEDVAVIIEKYQPGIELTVGLLDGTPLPVVQLAPKKEFYDYQAKYLTDSTEYFCPARLSAADAARVQSLAVTAWHALGLRDMSRIDFIISDHSIKNGDSSNGLIALEANTLPGMTAHSLLPKAAAVAGLDFTALCWKIVEICARRK